MKQLDDTLRDGHAWHDFIRQIQTAGDYQAYLSLCRRFRRMQEPVRDHCTTTIRVGILGSANTDFLGEPLAVELCPHRIAAETYVAPFNTYAHEILHEDSAIHRFKPDLVVLSLASAVQPVWPDAGDSVEEVDLKVQQACSYWLDLCKRLHDRVHCDIVMDNFAQLPVRPYGNLATKLPGDRNRFLRCLNDQLAATAPKYVHFNDVAWLSAAYGMFQWHDDRYWHHAKQAVSFQCLVPYVKNIARVIAATVGSTRKVLVLDLDNTLWGGVIGDDGLEGIRLGPGTAEGEAYAELQRYILDLKRRGVLLAICSKNEFENARLPFDQHPESILKFEDFVCVEANWDPKPDNLLRIAGRLNLGIDSFVFLDDNPAEREIVRQYLPEVLVIDLPEDPADYTRVLDSSGAFEVTAISSEDKDRTRQYQDNLQREDLLTSVSDYDSYLRTLDQKAIVGAFPVERLERITQLINKTNQFNLTTVRMTRSEVEALLEDNSAFTLCVELADKFGDNGLISVVIGTWIDNHELRIDTWLMSCRVLKRGVERLVCNQIVRHARQRGAQFISGTYIPSKKNAMVARHYEELGFGQVACDDDGMTGWKLDVAGYHNYQVPIEFEER